MLTFQDQYQMLQEQSGNYESAELTRFKRDLNRGATIAGNKVGRKAMREYKVADIEEDKQYYQFSADVLRISTIRCKNGTTWYTPTEIDNEDDWNRLNAITQTGNVVTHFFIRGAREVALYPVPSSNLSESLEVSFEPTQPLLRADDFTTGTVTVANGSVTITHSGTSFTPQMVGRCFEVTDGSDTRYYRIASYTSSSVLKLENYYEGVSGSGRSFRIGEVFKLPDEALEAPVEYATWRYETRQKDKRAADDAKDSFNEILRTVKRTYGKSTTNPVSKRLHRGRRAKWIDLTPPIDYP